MKRATSTPMEVSVDRDLILILVAIATGVLLLAALAYSFARSRRRFGPERRGELRERFGPEYDALARERGEKRAARELDHRVRRVRKLHIESLSRRDRSRYTDAWIATQRRFVDDPGAAVLEADELVQDVMRTRGYPVGDFDQRVRDVSVDHPNVVSNYRSARALAERSERGDATTEELRKAMMHYRVLFAELLEDGGPRGPVPFNKERYA
jgi:hypothetical protein